MAHVRPMTLYPLPLGQHDARLFSQAAQYAAAQQDVAPLVEVRSLQRDGKFASVLAKGRVDGMNWLANSALALQVNMEQPASWHLLVPAHGGGVVRFRNRHYALVAGRDALILPDASRQFVRDAAAGLMMEIDPGRIAATHAACAGPDAPALMLGEEPCPLDLTRNPAAFETFNAVCRLIDSTYADPALARQLGVSDVIYRWIAANAAPPARPEQLRLPLPATRSRLDELCDHIRETRERPLTLTEMCATAAMSARALQYGFRERFGCSPMEWQRRERMLIAQGLLEKAAPRSITELAMDFGFSTPAAFTTQYRRYIGEAPSATLRRTGRRIAHSDNNPAQT